MSRTTTVIAGIELVLIETSRGPKLAHTPATEPLEWLINLALEGSIPEFRESLTQGRDVAYKGITASRLASGEYRLAGNFFDATMTLPASTILAVLSALEARQIPEPRIGRISYQTIAGFDVQVLMTPNGPRMTSWGGEIALLAYIINPALEGKLRDPRGTIERGERVEYDGSFAEPIGSGNYLLRGDFYDETLTLPASTILEIYSTLEAQWLPEDKRTPEPVSEPDPPFVRPPFERLELPRTLPDLERRAVELDRMVERERTEANLDEEARHRALLLLDMQDAGVLDRDARRPEGYPVLSTYYDASRKLGQYLESHERGDRNPDAEPTTLIGAPVSLDWFRLPPPPGPSRFSDLEWLAHLERALGEDRGDERGEVWLRFGYDLWTMHWRLEDGMHRAVVSIEAPEPREPGLRVGQVYRLMRDPDAPRPVWNLPEAKPHVLAVLNRPERIFSGVDETYRRVDVYLANGSAVITEGMQKDVVVTAFGPTIDGSERVDPARWVDDPNFREIVR